MKGLKLLTGIEDLKLINSDRDYSPKKQIKELEEQKKFIEKGYFNGDLMGCENYDFSDNSLTLNNIKIKFFDFLKNRSDDKEMPKLVNVNGLVNIEDHLVIIKRDNNVFSYRNYLDLPAGLLSYKEKPEDKLFIKIKEDIGIPKDYLKIDKLVCAGISSRYLPLFYKVSCSLSIKEAKGFFKDKSKKISLIPINDIKSYSKSNRFVFPEVFSRFY